jgi:hypothetical protein
VVILRDFGDSGPKKPCYRSSQRVEKSWLGVVMASPHAENYPE